MVTPFQRVVGGHDGFRAAFQKAHAKGRRNNIPRTGRWSKSEDEVPRKFSLLLARKCLSSAAACQYLGSSPCNPLMKATAMVPLKNGSSPYTSSPRPQRGSRARSACGPHSIRIWRWYFVSLGDEARFVALDSAGLADQIGVPGFAHARRLRELGGGDRGAFETAFGSALDYAVDSLRCADVGDAQARDGGAGAETIHFFFDGHEGEEIADAFFGIERWIFVGLSGLGEVQRGREGERLGCSHRLVSCWFCERFKASMGKRRPLTDAVCSGPERRSLTRHRRNQTGFRDGHTSEGSRLDPRRARPPHCVASSAVLTLPCGRGSVDFVKVGTFEKPIRRPVHIEQQACRQKYPAIFGKNLTT